MKNVLMSRLLKGDEKNISRSCFVWNTIAGGINAAEAVVLMMVITRTSGVGAAGLLSIAFAVGNLLMTIGKFGVRNYQVTDVKNKYSFNDYHTLRLGTTALMALVSMGYAGFKLYFGEYSIEKGWVVLGICLIYIIESYEDVFLGYYQKEGRLDIASKVFIFRWIAIMSVFTVIAVIRKQLPEAVGIACVVSLLCEIYLILVSKKLFALPQIKITGKHIISLAKQCAALFLAGFLTYYITNAPKYAIDAYLSEEVQAYYGYISMPVFIVELLNCFLYQPQMLELANVWNDNNFRVFNKRVVRQYAVIIGLTVFCVLGAFLLGIPVLSFIYGVELEKFRTDLVLLMIAGGALAFVGYTSVLLTIMRRQQLLLYNMLIVTLMAILGFGKIVIAQGMRGAVKYYMVIMFLLALLNFCCTMIVEYKRKNKYQP